MQENSKYQTWDNVYEEISDSIKGNLATETINDLKSELRAKKIVIGCLVAVIVLLGFANYHSANQWRKKLFGMSDGLGEDKK